MTTSTSDPAPERPDRMWQRGRAVDPYFDADESLYRRVTLDDVSGERMLGPRIAYKNMSVNRQRYSEPSDVTVGYPGHGAVRFMVAMVRRPVPSENGGADWAFSPIHQPLHDNFAHTEIWAYRDGKRVPLPDPPTSIKKKYRTMMADHSKVVLAPTVHDIVTPR